MEKRLACETNALLSWLDKDSSFSCVIVEMCPRWFENSKVPFENMWPDDYMWYPDMLSGKYFDGYVLFEGNDHVLESNFTKRSPEPLSLSV